MTIEKGDQVMWRGAKAKVLRVSPSGLLLSIGRGQTRANITDAEEIPEPAPATKKSSAGTRKPTQSASGRKRTGGK